jgi:hypothetical protein
MISAKAAVCLPLGVDRWFDSARERYEREIFPAKVGQVPVV